MTHKEYADSLRMIADFFEAHEELPLPHDAEVFPIYSVSDREDLQPWLRALGSIEKRFDGHWFRPRHRFGTIDLELVLYRENICRRVVKGVETVTVLEADPEALKKVPMREVTREQEIVEWECDEPVLQEQA
jgi:hypothetical protein